MKSPPSGHVSTMAHHTIAAIPDDTADLTGTWPRLRGEDASGEARIDAPTAAELTATEPAVEDPIAA